MKRYIIFFSLICVFGLDAQVYRFYHHSGTVYSGYLLSKNQDSTVVMTIRGNQIKLSNTELDSTKITSVNKLRREYKSTMSPEKSGWFNLVECNANFIFDGDLALGPGLFRGYKFKSNLSTALGASVLFDYEGTKLRIGSQNRWDIKTKGNFPFVIGEFGWQRLLNEPILYKPFYWQLGAGYCFKTMKGGSWLISAGCTQNMRRFKVYDPDVFFSSNPSQIYYSDWFYDYHPFIKLSRRF